MTPAAFRTLALSHPETEERRHMNHPDFRVAGKIFATLGYPDKTRGMVKLSPEDQHYFSKDYPEVFIPVKGTWGRRGATSSKPQRKKFLPKPLQPHGATLPRAASWAPRNGPQRQGFHSSAKIGPVGWAEGKR